MKRRYRVERERTDTGYGRWWIILDPDGICCGVTATHDDAITVARYIARAATP